MSGRPPRAVKGDRSVGCDVAMPRLPRRTPREVIRLLEAAGWRELKGRGKGSHRVHVGPGGTRVTIPGKANRPLPVGLLSSLLRNANLAEDGQDTDDDAAADLDEGSASEDQP